MNLLSLLSLAAFIIHLSIGIYSIQSNRRSAQNVSFAIASFALSIMAFSFSFLYRSAISTEDYRFWFIVSVAGWTIGAAAFAHFSIHLTGLSKRFKDRFSVPIFYGAGIALYVIGIILLSNADIDRDTNIILMIKDISLPYLVCYLVFQFLCLVVFSVLLIINWGVITNNVREKKEAFTIVASILAFVLLTYTWDFIDFKLHTGIFSITPIFSLFWSCGILFAITKFRALSLSPSYVADQIVSNMSDLMILLDTDLSIIRINNRVQNILEYGSNELLGKSVFNYIQDSPSNKDDLKNALKNNDYGKFSWEAELKTKSGAPVPVRLIAWEVNDKKGFKIGTVLIGHDMRIFHDMQITNMRIAQALTYLEKSTGDLQHFIYTASIALKEPLRMIGSFSTLVSHKLDANPPDVGAIKELQKYVLDGVNRMNELLNALLEYSRIETHAKPFDNTDLNVSLHTAMKRLEREIAESSAVITNDKLPTVMADMLQMETLLYHLLRNALFYHKEGVNPEIHIGMETSERFVVVFVADNGIGIDPAFREDIFALFRRLNTYQEAPGAGVGLSICKKIVEMHGGNMWVESEPDKGSRFYFSIKESS